MIVTRSQTGTDRISALARDLARLNTPCIGCADCRGLCRVLIDALVLPDLIVPRIRQSARQSSPDSPTGYPPA
jgi:hypothetical protein